MNLTAENPRPIHEGVCVCVSVCVRVCVCVCVCANTVEPSGKDVEFSYEVEWRPLDIPFAKRFERYLRDDFLEVTLRSHVRCVGVCVDVSACVSLFVCACLCVCVSVCECECLCVCLCVCLCLCVSVCLCLCVCVCACICVRHVPKCHIVLYV